jgi:excisionase family DNA binding protein
MTPHNSNRATMTVGELAQTLGVSKGTAGRLIRAQIVPSIRAGRRVLISRAVVDRILDSGRWPHEVPGADADDQHRTTRPGRGSGR